MFYIETICSHYLGWWDIEILQEVGFVGMEGSLNGDILQYKISSVVRENIICVSIVIGRIAGFVERRDSEEFSYLYSIFVCSDIVTTLEQVCKYDYNQLPVLYYPFYIKI